MLINFPLSLLINAKVLACVHVAIVSVGFTKYSRF
jgi:hypothetical protein